MHSTHNQKVLPWMSHWHVMLVMCYDADLHKMQLTSAGKKILTFVSIQSGDISVYRSCHVLLQPSAVTSSSDKRR